MQYNDLSVSSMLGLTIAVSSLLSGLCVNEFLTDACHTEAILRNLVFVGK